MSLLADTQARPSGTHNMLDRGYDRPIVNVGPALGHFEPSNLDPLTTEFWADYRERFGRRP